MPGSRTPHFSLLTVFFPMWNEEEYIERALAAAREAVRALIDAGRDRRLRAAHHRRRLHRRAPARIADEMAAADRHVRVVHHPMNRKLGGSLKTGFAEATRRPHPLHRRRPALRHGRAGEGVPADAPLRGRHRQRLPLRPHRRGLRARRLLDDLQRAGAPAVRRAACATSTSPSSCAGGGCSTTIELDSEGSFIDAELIIRAQRLGYKVVQFGVDYFPRTRGVSTLSLAGGDREDPPARCGPSGPSSSGPGPAPRARSPPRADSRPPPVLLASVDVPGPPPGAV